MLVTQTQLGPLTQGALDTELPMRPPNTLQIEANCRDAEVAFACKAESLMENEFLLQLPRAPGVQPLGRGATELPPRVLEMGAFVLLYIQAEPTDSLNQIRKEISS